MRCLGFSPGLRPGDIAVNCVPAGGLTTGGWGPGEGLRIVGATAFHVGGTFSTDAKIDLMLRIGEVNFIYASTNYLHTLTEAMLPPRRWSRNARFRPCAPCSSPPRATRSSGRSAIEALWGCRLQEGYGSTQCAGFGGFDMRRRRRCRRPASRGLMHLFEWETLFEVHRSGDARCRSASGETGELVVTNLSIEGLPSFVSAPATPRATSRIATPASGRAWDAIECGTIGRFDDMLKIRGNNVWPSAIDSAVFAYGEVAEYAGRVYTSADGKTEIEVRVALADHAGLRRRGQRAIALMPSARASRNVPISG